MLSDFRSQGGEKWDELLTQIVATLLEAELVNAGNDGAQLPPMLDQLEERYERVPDEALVDGGFATTETIDQATERGCTVYAPVKDEEKQRAAGKIPMPARSGTAMRPPRGGAEWGPKQRNRSIGCEPRQRSGSTRSVATAASGTCPYAVNRDVVSSHCCLQLLTI